MQLLSSELTRKELLRLREKITPLKWDSREKSIAFWLNSFIDYAKADGLFTSAVTLRWARLTSTILNFSYWNLYNQYLKEHLNSISIDDRINHYKIAAGTEYVIMNHYPFILKEDGSPHNLLNAKFATFSALQILFNWNINHDVDAEKISDLGKSENSPTMKFFEEHEKWLMTHGKDNPCVIFSNMQTMRLLHYWFQNPNDKGVSEFDTQLTNDGY